LVTEGLTSDNESAAEAGTAELVSRKTMIDILIIIRNILPPQQQRAIQYNTPGKTRDGNNLQDTDRVGMER